MFTKALISIFWSPNLFPAILVILLIFTFAVIVIIAKFAYFSVIRQRIYKQKNGNLLSPGEKVFFESLNKAIISDLYVCPKVRVADLIETESSLKGSEFWQSFNKISQKHVDFVLCNKNDFAVKVAIELDDKSHSLGERIKRDKFMDEVFEQANISLLHIHASSFYDINILRDEIYKLISVPTPI